MSPWIAQCPDICMAPPLTFFRSLIKCHLLRGALTCHHMQIIPPHTLLIWHALNLSPCFFSLFSTYHHSVHSIFTWMFIVSASKIWVLISSSPSSIFSAVKTNKQTKTGLISLNKSFCYWWPDIDPYNVVVLIFLSY